MLMTVVSMGFGSMPGMVLGSLLCEAAQRLLIPAAAMLRPGEGASLLSTVKSWSLTSESPCFL